jgi:hypothetical protein
VASVFLWSRVLGLGSCVLGGINSALPLRLPCQSEETMTARRCLSLSKVPDEGPTLARRVESRLTPMCRNLFPSSSILPVKQKTMWLVCLNSTRLQTACTIRSRHSRARVGPKANSHPQFTIYNLQLPYTPSASRTLALKMFTPS